MTVANAFIYKIGDITQIIIYSLKRHNIIDDVVSSDISQIIGLTWV